MPRERVQHGLITLRTEGPGTAEIPGAILTAPWNPGDPVPPGGTLHEEPSLDVTWNRDGSWVQIAFDAPREWWDGFIDSYRGSPEQHHFAAYSGTLNRRQINHMIKTLRRARDAAYGADE